MGRVIPLRGLRQRVAERLQELGSERLRERVAERKQGLGSERKLELRQGCQRGKRRR